MHRQMPSQENVCNLNQRPIYYPTNVNYQRTNVKPGIYCNGRVAEFPKSPNRRSHFEYFQDQNSNCHWNNLNLQKMSMFMRRHPAFPIIQPQINYQNFNGLDLFPSHFNKMYQPMQNHPQTGFINSNRMLTPPPHFSISSLIQTPPSSPCSRRGALKIITPEGKCSNESQRINTKTTSEISLPTNSGDLENKSPKLSDQFKELLLCTLILQSIKMSEVDSLSSCSQEELSNKDLDVDDGINVIIRPFKLSSFPLMQHPRSQSKSSIPDPPLLNLNSLTNQLHQQIV